MTIQTEMTAAAAVVGSGCAGLNCVDTLLSLGYTDVLLITEGMNCGTSRNTGSDKQTYYKLSLSGDEGDSVGEMARTFLQKDTHGDTALCEAAGSVPSFMKLCALGVPFPRNAYGEYVGYRTDHDTRTRATSAGPLTSRYMTEALERSVRQRGARIRDHLLVFEILCGEEGVTGLLGYDLAEKRVCHIACGNVVLATGGPAHIYRDRVYPASQHGMSGMAFACGARGANLHCFQYGLASVGFRWNVSGSYQQVMPRYVSVDETGTEREFLADSLGEKEALRLTFLKGYEWPFSPEKLPGSSQVDLLVKAEVLKGRRVYLDYRRNPRGYALEALSEEARNYLTESEATQAIPVQRLQAMNEPAYALYREHGIDLEKDPLEIRFCCQHHNGGIAVDAFWKTCVEGLYACGEAAGTFGEKRPGGSALNSTQVGSMRAAQAIAAGKRNARCDRQVEHTLYLPRIQKGRNSEWFQAAMSACAMPEYDVSGMRTLLHAVQEALSDMEDVTGPVADMEERLKLRDILWTQQEVLPSILYSMQEETEVQGVLETDHGVCRRIPSRGMDARDLWFERVWKKYRAEQTEKLPARAEAQEAEA
ncbi:MAG: FAD-binding protein [Clostridia bacterium]|nr:FAD-binding protein [Clostridia bacterium]